MKEINPDIKVNGGNFIERREKERYLNCELMARKRLDIGSPKEEVFFFFFKFLIFFKF